MSGVTVLAACAGLHAFEVRDLLAFNLGPVVVKPRLTTAAFYGDNIFSLPDNSPAEALGLIKSRDDFFFRIGPELRARLGRPEGEIGVDFSYRFEQLLYVENTQADSSNHYLTLGGNYDRGRWNYSGRAGVQFLNSIVSSYESTEEGIIIPSGALERQAYSTSHTVNYQLTYKSRLRAEASVSRREYPGEDLERNRYLDSTDWRTGAGYDYAVSQNIRLGFLGHFGQILQDDRPGLQLSSRDADVWGFSLTASGSFTRKLSGEVRVGYDFRDYHRADFGSDDYYTAGASLSYQVSEKTAASINYSRRGGSSASIGSGTVQDSVGLQLSQAVGARSPWFFNAGVRYAHTDFVDRDLSLETLQVTAGAAHQLRRWASAFINYSFETGQRERFDYEAHLVAVGLTIGL